MNSHIDEGTESAGRDPRDVRRLLNIAGQFACTSRGFLQGPSAHWVDQLADTTLRNSTSGYILMSDDTTTTERFAAEVAPAVRDEVRRARW